MLRKNNSIISKLFISIFILTLQIITAHAEYTPLTKEQLNELVPSSTRFIVSLAGKWEMSYNGANWDYVNLPYSNPNEEKVTYRRTIKIDKKLLNQYSWNLYFMGIDDQVEIYMNGQFIGRFFGGMSPFSVRIPQRMIYGETNIIELVVSPATGAAKEIKTQNMFSKKIYTGVIREVLLIGNPHLWVNEIKYKTQFKSQSACTLLTTANISSGDIQKLFTSGALADSIKSPVSDKITVTIESILRKKANKEVVAQSQQKTVTFESERSITEEMPSFISNPELWSPENPVLYELVVKISRNGHVIDELSTDIGFRELTIASNDKGSGLYLNGKYFEINGTSYIESYYGCGATLTADRMEKDIQLMKTLGANVVRMKYSPPHPYFAKLCDKYGLFILVELPAYEIPASILASDEIRVRMKNIAKRLIGAYDNNPSVLAWGISDGLEEATPENKEYSNFISKLFKTSSSKLIYKIVLFGSKSIDTENLDFIGLRNDREKYNPVIFSEEVANLVGLTNNKPVFLLYGIPIQPKNHNGYSDPLSIESQAFYIRNCFHIAKDKKCAGSIISTFNDYLLNNPVLSINNDEQNLLSIGLVDSKRDQRLSFSTLKALFNGEREPLLNAGSFSEETPITFIIVGILLGLILVFIINRFRRFREYLFRAFLRPYNFYQDIRDQRIMSSVQNVLLWIIISTTLGIFLSSIFYYYRTHILFQYLFMLVLPQTSLQELLFRLIWIPELLMVITSIIFMIIALVIAAFIRLFAFFIPGKIFYRDTFAITVWASVPLLILLPFSIVLIRLMIYTPSFNWIVTVILVAIIVWVFLRMLRSTSVVYDLPSYKVYLVGIGIVVALKIILLCIYQYEYTLFAFLQYFMNVLIKY